jgi:hypothetical protein
MAITFPSRFATDPTITPGLRDDCIAFLDVRKLFPDAGISLAGHNDGAMIAFNWRQRIMDGLPTAGIPGDRQPGIDLFCLQKLHC